MLWPLGAFLALLYHMLPGVPVFGGFLWLCQAGSIWCILRRSLRFARTGRGKLFLNLAETAAAGSLLFYHLVFVQYTVTGGLLMTAALFRFLTSEGAAGGVCRFLWKNMPSVLLALLSFMLRPEMMLLLLPLAALATPNIPEGEVLSGMSIQSREDMEQAAKKISAAFSCPVLLKGGHALCDADDLLCAEGKLTWFHGDRIDNPNTHGTGCTLSSAIASNLAKGFDLETSVERAKQYISGALSAMLDLGRGSGPMDHMFDLRSRFIGGEAEA